MKLYLTKGMFGDRLEQIGDETKNVKTILEYIFGWKNNDEHRHQYKIENFDRFVFGKNEIAIDFGDYKTFMLIDGINEELKCQFQNLH